MTESTPGRAARQTARTTRGHATATFAQHLETLPPLLGQSNAPSKPLEPNHGPCSDQTRQKRTPGWGATLSERVEALEAWNEDIEVHVRRLAERMMRELEGRVGRLEAAAEVRLGRFDAELVAVRTFPRDHADDERREGFVTGVEAVMAHLAKEKKGTGTSGRN